MFSDCSQPFTSARLALARSGLVCRASAWRRAHTDKPVLVCVVQMLTSGPMDDIAFRIDATMESTWMENEFAVAAEVDTNFLALVLKDGLRGMTGGAMRSQRHTRAGPWGRELVPGPTPAGTTFPVASSSSMTGSISKLPAEDPKSEEVSLSAQRIVVAVDTAPMDATLGSEAMSRSFTTASKLISRVASLSPAGIEALRRLGCELGGFATEIKVFFSKMTRPSCSMQNVLAASRAGAGSAMVALEYGADNCEGMFFNVAPRDETFS